MRSNLCKFRNKLLFMFHLFVAIVIMYAVYCIHNNYRWNYYLVLIFSFSFLRLFWEYESMKFIMKIKTGKWKPQKYDSFRSVFSFLEGIHGKVINEISQHHALVYTMDYGVEYSYVTSLTKLKLKSQWNNRESWIILALIFECLNIGSR